MDQQNGPKKFDFRPQPVDVTKPQPKSAGKSGIKKFFTTKPSKKHLITFGGGAVLILLLGVGAIMAFSPEAPTPNPEPEVTSNYEPPAPTTVASPLTGVQVKPELAERTVTGIMIENSVDARPQAGLRDAGVVFEAIAEGGITRFLALFQESQPGYIGPIRSARPYYVQWVKGFDAGYVHSGGSPQGLALIQALGVKDMDHAHNPGYFDRVSNRYAPHNVYTSMDRLDKLRKEKGFTDASKFTPFARISEPDGEDKDSAAPGSVKDATKITFNISGPLYNTNYSYDSKNNNYKRKLAGQPHLDERSGKQITPSVVIALITDYSIHSDGIHSVYKTVGSGKAIVFQNGKVITGKWHKRDRSSSLEFLTKDGEQLKLQPGQTWITAVPEGRVSYAP